MFVQISTLRESFAVDCLAMRDEIALLKEIFEDANILKVFHGGSNDLKALLSNFGVRVKNMFDTALAFVKLEQVICSSKTAPNQKSLKLLCDVFMNLPVDKGYQTGNYRLRPITNKMLEYALNDAKLVLHVFFVMVDFFQHFDLDNPFHRETLSKIVAKVNCKVSLEKSAVLVQKARLDVEIVQECVDQLVRNETNKVNHIKLLNIDF